MDQSIKNTIDSYLNELNTLHLPYSSEVLERKSLIGFGYEGLSSYDQMPNVKELILLRSQEHPETLSEFKFLVIEVYDKPTPEGHQYGVPSFSFIRDVSNDCDVACYMLDDETVQTFKSPVDAILNAVQKFELDNYQRSMSIDLIEYNLSDFDADADKEIASLVMANSLINSFNKFGRDLFKCDIDIDTPKLFVACPKYDNWTDIIDTGEKGNIHQQVIAITNENYARYIEETIDLAKVYCEEDLKSAKKHKIKPS